MLALEPDAQPGVRAPRGRHADAPARSHLRRGVRPRRGDVPDDGGRPECGDRDGRRPCAPGGVVLLVPDTTREMLRAGHGSRRSRRDGRAKRCATSSGRIAPDPRTRRRTTSTSRIVVREPGAPVRVVHDHHVLGLFPRGVPGTASCEAQGSSSSRRSTSRPARRASTPAFVAAAARLTPSGRISTLRGEHTFVHRRPGETDAYRTSAGDLAVPRRVRGRPRLPADGS